MLDRLLDHYCRALSAIMAFCLAAMVLMVFGNVVLRYGFNSGIAVSEELSRWLFLWLVFLGAVVAIRERAHMGVDMLIARLPPLGQRMGLLIGHGLMLFATWLMFQGSLAQTRINWDVQAPVTGWSMGWAYGSGVVFAASAGCLLLIDLWRIVTGRLTLAHMHSPRGLEPSEASASASPDPKH
ncbi:TRAP transporter small permease [Tepidimonas sp.]|uniref:TRAP transporter small permease n=1 Tax=Tepidimonas sp. TaxID=2002775 RepID=UPI0039196A1F